MLRSDDEATQLLHAAGANQPQPLARAGEKTLADFAASIRPPAPMLAIPDVDATVTWYRALGFSLAGSHEGDGRIDWASLTLGEAELVFVPSPKPQESSRRLSLWFRTDRLDELYALLKACSSSAAAPTSPARRPTCPTCASSRPAHRLLRPARILRPRSDRAGAVVLRAAPDTDP
jgi:hypothetical protein